MCSQNTPSPLCPSPNPPQSYLIVIIQPHPLQSHNLMGLPVFGLEHCSIGA